MLGKLLHKLLSRNKAAPQQVQPLSRNLKANLEMLRETFGTAHDLVVREFTVGSLFKEAGLVYIDGLIDKESVSQHLIKSLMLEERLTVSPPGTNLADLLNFFKKSSLTIAKYNEVQTLPAVVDGILKGETAFFLEGYNTALLLDTRGFEKRAISEPATEVVVRGSREGFTETLSVNISLVRRRLKTPSLQIENMTLGRQTRTDVCIVYLKNIANEEIVMEVKRRLRRIDIDAILESGYIEQLIEDAPYSIFPTVGNTEKPDTVVAKLLEGRVALLVEGTPFALTVPYLFIEAFQTAEDYYSRPYYATLLRWLRFIACFMTVTVPALYVAVVSFHHEVIPAVLLPLIAAGEEATPFPSAAEALIMGIVFEILREAGVRLPRAVGIAISIVGALVLGEAAVSAGLVGSPMVIVVALTAITSFIIPSLVDANAIMRLVMTLLAGFMGITGILWGLTVLLIHLCSLRSFGIPYLAPMIPVTTGDLKDALIRAPWWSMLLRPRSLNLHNQKRMESDLKPKPANAEKG